MRFATWDDGGVVTAGVVGEHGLHALPADVTVLDLVRAGLPAALDAGLAALSAPPVPLGEVRLLPPLQPPTVRDFVAFEEHVEGVVASSLYLGTATQVIVRLHDDTRMTVLVPNTDEEARRRLPAAGDNARLSWSAENIHMVKENRAQPAEPAASAKEGANP